MMALLVVAATHLLALGSGNHLSIEGTLNRSPWSCEATAPNASVVLDPSSPDLVRALSLRVPVAAIECGNGPMNGKMREALHADQFPIIEYRLTRAERIPDAGKELEATGDLTINGRTRRAVFQVSVTSLPDGSAEAMGSLVMLMSDFGIEPPTALFGLFRASDEITVKFAVRTVLRGAREVSAR